MHYDDLAQFATVRELEYLDAIKSEGSHNKAARKLKVHRSVVDRAIIRIRQRAAKQGYSPEHNYTKVVPDGFTVSGVSQYYNKEGALAAQWVKSSADKQAQEALMREVVSAMSEDIRRADPIEPPLCVLRDDLLNLYTFTDYHLGMLAWEKEGGANWDLKIAEQVLWDSFRKMIEASPLASSAVLNIQGDFLHSDGLLPVTPAHKHVLDQDGRFSKIVSVAIRILRRMIDHSLQRHQNVHLIICEGNHDEASSVWLRQMFAALYDQEPRLSVNASELPYYVHQHGSVMLAFHHGHKLKNEAMPMLFAAQFPVLWGLTTKRYCHTGHRHHVDEKEYGGMIVTQHPTLSARDAYAARGGWIADRAAMAITYHNRAGQCSRVFITPELLL